MKNILCYGDSNTWNCKPDVIHLSDSYIMMTLWICEEGQYKTLAAKFEL